MSKTQLMSQQASFERNFSDARGYHDRGVMFQQEKRRPSLVFNVASVAIESYLIAICAYHNVMPFNHNYSGLLEDAEQLVAFTPKLSQAICSLDQIYGICSVDNYHHGEAGDLDAERALWICDCLLNMLKEMQLTPMVHSA